MAMTTAQIDKEIARLKEERKKAAAAEKEAAIKAEQEAKERIGAIVVALCPSGWERLDAEGFVSALRGHPELLPQRAADDTADPLKQWRAINPKKLAPAGSPGPGKKNPKEAS